VLLNNPLRAGSAAIMRRLLKDTVFIFFLLALPSKPFIEFLFLLDDDWSLCCPPVLVTF